MQLEGGANDNSPGKVCTKCGAWKVLAGFSYRNGKPIADCKSCVYDRVKEWRQRPGNKERKNEVERRRRKDPEVAAKYAAYNKERRRRPDVNNRYNAARRKRRSTDIAYAEAERRAKREYYKRPDIVEREKAKRRKIQSTKEWKDNLNAQRRDRYASDPLYFCAVKCRQLVIRAARKAKTEKSTSTIESLGYSPEQLKQRLECQFQPGMSWLNHGDWHIDHRKPVAAFIAQGITESKTINALCNLLPMWGDENQAKSSTWPPIPANDNKESARDAA